MSGASETDRVLDTVASPERAVAVISELVGPSIAFGPLPVGPHGMATASATGTVGRLTARRLGPGRGIVSVPARLDVSVRIGRRLVPVDVDLTVHVGLTARLAGDVVEVEVAAIGAGDIDVDARTSGAGGVIVRRMADLDGEIRHHVGNYVSTLLASPEALAARRLPVDGARTAEAASERRYSR